MQNDCGAKAELKNEIRDSAFKVQQQIQAMENRMFWVATVQVWLSLILFTALCYLVKAN